jgi:hypothetical protein
MPGLSGYRRSCLGTEMLNSNVLFGEQAGREGFQLAEMQVLN